jgi:hypothetical protein
VTGQSPRHASAEPEACHGACFLLRLACRVSIPAQKEKGAGFKTRGSAASVGRRQFAEVVSFGFRAQITQDAFLRQKPV